ncbi:type 4a pilus biogenesis protein PilO [Candidatus Poribacteria bacterium]
MAPENIKKILIVVSVFLIVFAAFFFLFWRPEFGKLRASQIKLKEKQAELMQLEQDARDWPDSITREKLGRYEAELVQLWELIPSEEQVSMLLKEIETHARDSNMDIISLSRDLTNTGPAPRVAPATGPAAMTGSRYVKVPYRISLGGNYFGLIGFMRRLEDSKRLVTVTNTRVYTGQEGHIVGAEVQFNIFYSRVGV